MIRVIDKEGNEIPFTTHARRQIRRQIRKPPAMSFRCSMCKELTYIKYKVKISATSEEVYCPECGDIVKKRIKKKKREERKVNREDYSKYYKTRAIQSESIYFTEMRKSEISGICTLCGEVLIFPEYHHLFGRKESDFTVSMCIECHLSVRGEQHYISIGNRIEWGYLTTINHIEDTN